MARSGMTTSCSPPLRQGARQPFRRRAMRRIHLAIMLAATTLVVAACSTLGAVAGLLGNEVSFTAPQLQGYLDKRFPRDYDKLGGLVTLSVLHPRLSIPQGSQRLRDAQPRICLLY